MMCEHCETGLTWEDLTEAEKEQAIESYIFVITESEGKPCSRKRAEENIVGCSFERQDTGYIYVNI